MGFKKETKQPNILMVGYVEPLSLDYSLIFFAQIFFMQKKKNTAVEKSKYKINQA